MFKIVLIFPPTKNGGKFAAVEKTGNIPENFSPGYGAFYDNIGHWDEFLGTKNAAFLLLYLE
jgi:hypothetical protein